MVSSSISSSSNIASTKDSGSNFMAKNDSNGLDFKKIMKQSISSNTNTRSTEMAPKHASASTTTSSSSTSEKNDKDIKNDKGIKNDKDVVNKKDADNSNNVNKEINKTDNNKTVSDDDNNKIDGMMKEIKDEIKKTFGISDEQLQTAMENLGITMQDLLKPVNLTNLVCEITGTQNALSLLTDSGLSEQLKSVMDFVNSQVSSLAKDMNISVDNLKAYIGNASNSNVNADVNANTNANTNTNTNTNANVDPNVDPNANQEQVASSDVNKVQVDGNVSAVKVQADDVSKNINNQETTKTNSNEQLKSDLQAVVETKVTVVAEQQSNGSMSKDSNESNGKNHELNTVTNNLTQSIQSAFDNIVVEDASKINTADVIKQIVEAAKVTVTQQISSMEMQLNPENLGKINLTVVAKDGIITAQITAENEAVKKAIESQLTVLKENLYNQGIKVEAVEVTIASHSFENNRNSGQNDSNQENGGKQANKPFRLDSIEDLMENELSDEERRVMHMLKGNNSSVEYSA